MLVYDSARLDDGTWDCELVEVGHKRAEVTPSSSNPVRATRREKNTETPFDLVERMFGQKCLDECCLFSAPRGCGAELGEVGLVKKVDGSLVCCGAVGRAF